MASWGETAVVLTKFHTSTEAVFLILVPFSLHDRRVSSRPFTRHIHLLFVCALISGATITSQGTHLSYSKIENHKKL